MQTNNPVRNEVKLKDIEGGGGGGEGTVPCCFKDSGATKMNKNN